MRRAVLATAVLLQFTSTADARGTSQSRRSFSAEEFELLRQELHTLASPEEAERRFAEVEPLPAPPPRQGKIDHFVVLFMEVRPSLCGVRAVSAACQSGCKLPTDACLRATDWR